MSLLTTLLSGAGGGGGGSGSVTGIILSPVVAASTTARTVTYANGSSGVGATLTNAGTQAVFTIDGQTPTVGQRVLIKDQASALQNGVYTVTNVGSVSTNWVLTRATDFDQNSEMTAGTLVEVINGTVNAGTVWQLTTTVATVGTNSVTFISINITTKVDQNGSPIYAADTGAADAYVITLSPAPSAYTTGMVVRFKASAANATTTPTINVNGLGAKTIVKRVSTALAANDILANQFVELIYDGTNFVMWTIVGNAPATGTVTSVAGAGLASGTVTSTGNITVTAAVQSDQETATSTSVAVVPGVQQYHPSATKAWALSNSTLSALVVSYNVTSVTDGGTGVISFNLTVAFSTGNYQVSPGIFFNTTTAYSTMVQLSTSSQVTMYCVNSSSTLTDPGGGLMFSARGDQ